MKSVLLIGLGRFGKHVAIKLSEMKQQVMAIDTNEDCLNEVIETITSGIIGDATNRTFLKSLGIPNFDVCIVAIGDNFESSVVTTSLLKELGAKMVIARASKGIQERFLKTNGADIVIYPEKEMAEWTAVRSISRSILDYVEIDRDFGIYELAVPDDWAGKTLAELDVRKKYEVNILCMKKDGVRNMSLKPTSTFEKGMSVYALGPEKGIRKCFKFE